MMTAYPSSPRQLAHSLVSHRELLADLVMRDALGRYKGAILGAFWSFLTPVLMLAVYTFVFGEVFRARWGGANPQGRAGYAIVLFCGLVIFNFFSECLNRAPGLVLAHPNFVKKIVFPLELLSCVAVCSALFHAGISLVILLVAQLLVAGELHPGCLLLPLVLLPLAAMTAGLSWFISATGVYLRDLGQSIGLLVTALMFLSPVFFPVSSLPERFQGLAYLSPLAYPIEQVRSLLIQGTGMDWPRWGLYAGTSLLVAWLGFAWFQKVRSGFADVI